MQYSKNDFSYYKLQQILKWTLAFMRTFAFFDAYYHPENELIF